MITATKLKRLSNINADQLTEMMVEAGLDCTDEPLISTSFVGVEANSNHVNFIYEAQYAHVDGGIQIANIIVTYDTDSGTISTYYQE